ncbi:uncharacterized protein VTP21DRAFT_1493 [Calcarisporiella thermophila]|uniref:uncharacterized protein n=1 Tax=Calcarisporiella thermophila TaxID=911321 RepID=UPI003742FB0A
MDLSGKVAFITGSSKNMGRAFADALAKAGADVAVHHRSSNTKGEAEQTAQLVRAKGRRALIVEGELSNPKTVRAIFAKILETFGRVDIVINNAGKVIKKPFIDITEEDFDSSFGVNAKAAFFVMQEAARHIKDGGRIINMGTSLLGVTTPFYSVYAGSKAPLEDFTRALAKEIGERGVTVNTVAPGPIDTDFFHGQETPDSVSMFTQMSVAKRLGMIEDIVPVIEFLASPRSQWVTAQTLFVNGGLLAR